MNNEFDDHEDVEEFAEVKSQRNGKYWNDLKRHPWYEDLEEYIERYYIDDQFDFLGNRPYWEQA